MTAVVFALAGCGAPAAAPPVDGLLRTAGCSLPATPPPMPIDSASTPDDQVSLDDIGDQIDGAASARFASVYAGLEIRRTTSRIRVFRLPSAGFDRWIEGGFGSVCVELADARYSHQRLMDLRTRVFDEADYWRAKGIVITSIVAAHDGSAVLVAVTDVPRAEHELSARYGSDPPLVISPGGSAG